MLPPIALSIDKVVMPVYNASVARRDKMMRISLCAALLCAHMG